MGGYISTAAGSVTQPDSALHMIVNIYKGGPLIVAGGVLVVLLFYHLESILEEAYKVPGSHSGFFGGLGIGSDVIPDYNKMYKEQAALIHRLADKFGGVFLGRCADAVLADTPDCYHIFIYADDAFREKRSKEAYEGISLKEMDKEDVSRQRYYNYYTGRTWGDPLNYDLMINTGKIDLEDAADLIIDYIEKVQSE